MIKGITGTLGVTVFGGSSASPYINQNTNNPMQGMIRMSGIYCSIENGNLHMGTNDYLEALHKTFRSEE